jgi:hypothetical protein
VEQSDEGNSHLREIKNTICERHTVSFFGNDIDLAVGVAADLSGFLYDWQKRATAAAVEVAAPTGPASAAAFDAKRRHNVGVAVFTGQAWSGMRAAAQSLGLTFTLQDKPLDIQFLSQVGILIVPGCGFTGERQFSTGEVELVRDFVASGGGLLCAGQAWSWVYKEYGNKPIETFPLNALGRTMGFFITGRNIGAPNPASADTEVFGDMQGWHGADKWAPSEVKPLTGSVKSILRDFNERPIALRGDLGAGRLIVAGHEGLFEYNPEAFKAVLRFLRGTE